MRVATIAEVPMILTELAEAVKVRRTAIAQELEGLDAAYVALTHTTNPGGRRPLSAEKRSERSRTMKAYWRKRRRETGSGRER